VLGFGCVCVGKVCQPGTEAASVLCPGALGASSPERVLHSHPAVHPESPGTRVPGGVDVVRAGRLRGQHEFYEGVGRFTAKPKCPSSPTVTRFLVKLSPERSKARAASSRTMTWACAGRPEASCLPPRRSKARAGPSPASPRHRHRGSVVIAPAGQEEQRTPPGWYPQSDNPNWLRWWDGQQWTDKVRPAEPPQVFAPPAAGSAPSPAAPLAYRRKSGFVPELRIDQVELLK
jgi:hypothetical protein